MSAVDRYYRNIQKNIDDIQYKLQLAAILLKISENDNNSGNLNNKLTKVNNISQINTQKNENNLNLINTNITNISNNINQIKTNTRSCNLIIDQSNENKNLINANITNINNLNIISQNNTQKNENNLNLINTNITNISNNKEKIDNNIDQINENKNLINEFILEKPNYSINNFYIFKIDKQENYSINTTNPSFNIFSYNLEGNLNTNDIIIINCSLLYDYKSYSQIASLYHYFKFYDKDNLLIYEFKNLSCSADDDLLESLLHQDNFYVQLENSYDQIKVELYLNLVEGINSTITVSLINNFSSNYVCFKHYSKN